MTHSAEISKEGGGNGPSLEHVEHWKKDSLGSVRRKAGGICSWSNSTFPVFRKFKGQWKTKFHWRHNSHYVEPLKTSQTQQPPAQTPRKPPRHRRAVTNLQDIKIKEWCIKRCGNCNLSFSTVNLWILMTGSHLHLTISVLEHFLGTGDIFLSQ